MKKKVEKTEDMAEEVEDDKNQSKRFIETAKSLEADISGESFKDAFDSIGKKEKHSE